MEAKHAIWFRDPHLLIRNILANADFNGEIDISPFQEYDANDNHRYQIFMSGNWAWKQAVRVYFRLSPKIIYIHC